MLELKKKILLELNKKEFPNLKFLYSKEVLDISLEVLDELLEIDKNRFEDLLKIEKEKLVFDSFEDDSLLDYFWSLLNHLKTVNSWEQIRKITEEFRPKLQEFWNYVAYNKDYYEQLVYVEKNCELDEEQKRIMYLRIKAFKDRWINLDEEKQQQLKDINLKLSKLSDKFNNNIIDDEALFEYLVDDFEVVKNMPKEILEQAKQKDWKWYLFDADPTTYQAIMKYCDSSSVRKDFEDFRNSIACKGKYDNREIILEILELKNQKAIILWYNNYAEYSLNNKMADSPKQVIDFKEWILAKAKEKAYLEIKELKDYFKLTDLKSYDLAYYSNKYKEEKYSVDEKELKQYFEYNNSLKYLFDFVQDFYGIEMKKLDIESYDEDVIVYEIYKDWKLISYYFLDPFYNKNKRSWAWANNLREKTYLWNHKKVPIVLNVCNFQKVKWKITLYIRDVETIFHEFWHALHEILSESKYSELSWFWVEWDFVELPSQILENWVTDRESIKKLSKHIDTWKPLNSKMLDKLDSLKTYMSWCFVIRQNEFALLDMNIYIMKIPESILELDKKILDFVNKYWLFKRDNNYKMYCSFGHIFWWWYAAWYYSYMWAEILEADVFERIKEMWIFEKSTWEKFVKTILWQWTRKKAKELFYDFMWREVNDKAFLERKGLG